MLFENNAVDSSMYSVAGGTSGTVAYNSTYKVQGTYSLRPGYLGQWESANNFDPGTKFYVSLWFRTTLTSDNGVLIGSYPSGGSNGWYLRLNGTNNSFYLYTQGSGNADFIISNANVWLDATWHNVGIWIDRDNGKARIYLDGEKLSLSSNDSLIRNDFPYNTNHISISGYLDGNQGFNDNAYIDNVQIYNYLLNQSQIDSLITHVNDSPSFELGRDSGIPPEPPTYSPISGRHVWFTKDGVRLIPKHDGLSGYPKQKYRLASLDSIDFLFADNFETFPTGPLDYDTLISHFQVWKANFYEDNQLIIDLNDGDHEKVFHSKVLEGEYGASKGFEINIPLDSLYDEIWVDLDMRAMPGFNGDETPGYYSGKLPMGGAYGGLNYSYYGDSTRISSEEWGAWWAHTVWGSNESIHNYAYTLSGAKDVDGYIGQIPTSWKHYSTKIKVSDPGSLNGTKEVFIDGDYSSHLLGLKMRSIAQGEGYGLIEGVKLSFFFGGSGASYASQQDQWIEFDNIVVSYANSGTRKNTDLYTTGNKIWYPNSTMNNIQPDSILFCEDFTANSGTIQSHYTINRPPDSKRTYRKTITVTEGSHINIDFDYYRYDYDYGDNSWMKIYTGVGGSKSATPLYTFNRTNLPSTYSTYHISDNEVTIEYYMGTNNGPSKGWKLTYESITP